MRHGRTRPVDLAFMTWCLAVLAGPDVAARGDGLFTGVDAEAARDAGRWTGQSGTSVPPTIRGRLARIDLGMVDAARAAAGGARRSAALTLNLFEDAVFRARVEQSTPTRSGYALTGRLEGVPFGTMALVVNGPMVAGTVRTSAATWRIRSAGAELYAIHEIDLSTLPPGAEPLVAEADDRRISPAADGTRSGPRPPASPSLPMPRSADRAHADDDGSADDGSVIDLLVVYTPAAREAEGGTARIEALIDLWVAETNQAYANSGVIQRIALVRQKEVDYVETGEARLDLDRLRNPADGRLDDVHVLRDVYAADAVHLVFGEAEDACGAAWQMRVPEHEFERYAFTASGLDCGPLAFAHELGHVMGLRHDRYVEWDNERAYPYSAGYVNQRAFDAGAPESSRWRTVMADARQCRDAGFSCQPLLRFSNPDQTYRGDRLGVPGDSPTTAVDGPADARRSLNETRSVVAGFRDSRDRTGCRPVLAPERQLVPAAGGAFEVSVRIHHDCAWTPASDAAFVSLTGGGGVGSGVVTYEVGPNEGRPRVARLTFSGRVFLVEQVGPVDEGICDRTPLVRRAIMRTTGVERCWDVTSAHLSSIRWLNLIGQRIGTLKAGDFAGLSGMNQLSLDGNDLTSLPAGIFAGLSSLEHLGLYDNALTALPANAFADVSGLRSLGLSNNNLSALPAGIFAGLSDLERLYLGNNGLTALPGNVFAGLSGLERLGLSHNNLRALPAGIFAGLTTLEDLSLSDNALIALPEGAFANLSGLRVLGLGGNALVTLPAGAFAGLSRIERLFMYGNDLTSLPEGLFAGLDDLQLLWMSSNFLTALPEEIFRGLSNLEDLSLGYNPLGALPEGLFAGLSRLRRLSLSRSGLTELPPGIFADLAALRSLSLFENRLASLLAGVFAGPPGFTNLNLDRNPGAPFTLTLQPVRTGLTPTGGAVAVLVVEGAPFDMAVSLSATGGTLSADTAAIGAGRVLGDSVAVTRQASTVTVSPGPPPAIPRGSGCGHPQCITGLRLAVGDPVDISEPDEGICSRTPQVQQAIARAAGVEYCWDVTDAHLSAVDSLDLAGRGITGLRAGDFAGLFGLRALSLSGNELRRLPAGLFADLFRLQTLALFDNDLTALPGSVFGGLSRLEILNLANNDLTVLPGGVFAGLSSLRRMYLQDNHLNALPGNSFGNLFALEELHLAGNALTALPAGSFAGLARLEGLFLSGNELTTLPEEVFAGLPRLRSLRLGENALTALSAGSFAGLSNLESLLLPDNSLTTLPEGLFAGLVSLRELWLGSNALTALPAGIFDELSNLENLSLGGNPLRSLPERAFAGLSRLGHLSLADTGLRELPPGLFAELSALRSLGLSGNALTTLPAGIFAGLPGFDALALDDNPGAPFTLTLRLARTEKTPFGGAVAVEAAEGAPFDMALRLSVTGGTLSAYTVTIGAGRVASPGVAVTRRASTSVVRPGPAPAIPPGTGCDGPACITGLGLAAGGPVAFHEPVPFTDDPLRPGVTPVKAVHFREIRERIGRLRAAAGLPRFGWTDPVLTPGVTPVRRVHLLELREALAAAYAAAGGPAPAHADPALPEGTVIRAAHLTELRAAIVALE